MKRKITLALLTIAVLMGAQSTTRNVNLSWTASTTPACTSTVTTNCVSGYNVYRSTSSTGPWTTPLNSSPQTGVTYQDQSAVIGQTYSYAIMAYSVACTQTGPPTGWNFCGSSSPLIGTLTVPTAPGGVVGFAWSVQ